MGFTVIILLGPQAFFPELDRLRVGLLTAVLAVATYLWDCLLYRRPISILSTEIWLAAALAAWAIVTIPFSYSPRESLLVFLDLYAKSLIVFWLLGNVIGSVKRLRQTFWALSLMAIPLAFTGVEHFFSGIFLENSRRLMGFDAPLTANPNDLALMLNLILPLSIALLLTHRGKPLARAGLFGGVCLSAAAIILTFSRGGFLTLAALFVLYLWKLRRRSERRWIWMMVPVLLVCIPLLGPSYYDRLATIADIEKDETGSAQARWSDMEAAVRFTLRHPIIGAGIGQNMEALDEERPNPGEAVIHNVYLEHSTELGIIGLLLFVTLVIRSIKSVALVQRQLKREQRLPELFYLAEGLQLSLIAFAIAGFFHPVAYHFYFYYVAGLAVAAKALLEKEPWLCTTR
ncbi:MAG TPA: O-antigen ligase family protein [Candidatus Binatia bacterium]